MLLWSDVCSLLSACNLTPVSLVLVNLQMLLCLYFVVLMNSSDLCVWVVEGRNGLTASDSQGQKPNTTLSEGA